MHDDGNDIPVWTVALSLICWPLGVVIAITSSSECSDDSVIIPAQELQSPANGKFMSV